MNLMRIPWLARCLQSKWFPLVPQIAMLAVFCSLVLGGLGVSTDDAAFARILRNTNLASLVIWSYWWPVIIVATIVLGRIWCTLCPMELLTAIASGLGLRRRAPSWIRTGWVVTLFYMLILIVGIHTLAIHRLPHRMSLYLLMLMLTAVVVGLVYEKRAFCSYVCPVGHLLGFYALLAPFEWRADDLDKCSGCRTKDCVAGRNHYRLIGRSCTSNLYPAKIKDNRQCLLCTQCLKSCPYNNLRFSLRRPCRDLFGSPAFTWAQMVFLLVVAAFVVYEILSEWSSSKAVLIWIPGQIARLLTVDGAGASLLKAVVMFVFYPAVFLGCVYLLIRLFATVSLRLATQLLCLALLPTMAAAHTMKALLKMTSRIPYWSYAVSDPRGTITAAEIMDKTLVVDKAIPDALAPWLSYGCVFLLLIALAITLTIFRKSALFRQHALPVRIGVFLAAGFYWAVFAVTIVLWRF